MNDVTERERCDTLVWLVLRIQSIGNVIHGHSLVCYIFLYCIKIKPGPNPKV